MPAEERRARLEAIRAHVRAHDLAAWLAAQLADLDRAQYDARGVSELSHVDESGSVRMVDVGGKPMSRRRAVARATVRMAPETARAPPRAAEGRRARDRAARRDHGREAHERPDPALPPPAAVARRRRARGGRRRRRDHAAAETTAQTGVEMEALVAASVAALTVYDMAKAIDKEMVVAEVTLVEKTKADA